VFVLSSETTFPINWERPLPVDLFSELVTMQEHATKQAAA